MAKSFSWLWVFVCCVSAATVAFSQRAAESAVYVHDSGVAVEKLALAEKLERLKEWDKSADLYLEVATDFSDRVIAREADEQCYWSAGAVVQQRLAKWPADGVAAFRARFEPAAIAALETAGHDRAALRPITTRYFLTDAAKRAALTLTDDFLEAGEFSDALALARQFNEQHPQVSPDERAQFLLRIGVAAHRANQDPLANEVLQTLNRDHASAIGLLNGKDSGLGDALAAVLATPATQPMQREDRWLTPGGDLQRSRTIQKVQFGGARMGYRDIEASAPRGINPAQLRDWQRQFEAERTRGYCTGIFPVIDRGELFFQDNARLYAMNLDTGDALPGWSASYPETAGVYTLADAWPVPPGQPCLVTLTDDSVLATMGLMDYTAAQYVGTFNAHSTHLVCLDRRSGRPRWTFFSQQLPVNLANLDFAGCPLADAQTVYVQAHGTRGQFDDAYLLAFDRAEGTFRWSCYICSANVPGGEMDPTANPVPIATALAADGGSLIVQTNNGALAKIDPATPSITWLSKYPREGLSLDRNDVAGLIARRTQQIGPRRPWEHNAPIVSDGKIFSLPDDATSLLVCDAADGKLLKRILLSDYDLSRTLLGVSGNQIVFHSGKRVFCVDWTKYPDNVRPVPQQGNDPPARARNALVWMTNDLKRGGMPDDAIRGRGVLTTDSVIIPTAWQLMRFSLSGGGLKSTFPTLPNNQWSDDEGPGNLLLAGDQMIVGGTTASGAVRVSWYTDLREALRRLDAAEAQAPTKVEPRLHYAQALFTAGQIAEASRKLDEAIERAPAASADPASKAKLYTAAVEFGRRAGGNSRIDPNLAEGFFDRAAAYVNGPEQQVDFRLIRADFERDQKRFAEQIALYQQILNESSWRNINVLRGEDNTTAGMIAAESIATAAGADASAYATIEQAAQAALTQALQTQNVSALIEVAAAYPNSSVVGKALTAAAEQSQFAGAFRQSADLFRRALLMTTDNDERRRVLTRMAQCYLQLPGGTETAAGRLRQAARLSATARMSESLTLPDGRNITATTFGEAAAAVHAAALSNAPPLPDCSIPPNRRTSGDKHGALTDPFAVVDVSAAAGSFQSLLDCVDGFARNDRLIAQGGGGVAVFKPGNTMPLFRIPGIRHVLHTAWIGGSLALVEPRAITFVAGESGQKQWQVSLGDVPTPQRLIVSENLPPALRDDAADTGAGDFQPNFAQQRFRRIRRLNAAMAVDNSADAAEQFRLVAPLSDRLICATTSGRVLAMALTDGKLLWQRRVSDHGVVRLLATDDFVVAQTVEQATPINVLSTLSGETIQRGKVSERRFGNGLINATISSDGMLVLLSDTSLVGKDLFDPAKFSQPTYQFPGRGQPMAVAGAMFTDPSSPVIADRLIFALSDGGSHLRVFSLDDGQPVSFNQTQAIDTGTRGSALELAADGGRCYVASENWVKGYDIAHQIVWGDLNMPQIREIALTQSHVMALADQPNNPAAKRTLRKSELQLYSRAADQNGAESGWLEYRYALPDGFAPSEWQPVDGGVYLLSAERKLIFLAGQRGGPR